jgi:hypothetical protein
MGSVYPDSLCRLPQALTPLLTPLRAQYAETAGNHQQESRFR